jgi:hypothetical protein
MSMDMSRGDMSLPGRRSGSARPQSGITISGSRSAGKKIYIGCSLTYASEEFRKEIDDLKTSLRKKYEVLDFFGMLDGDPREIYLNDTGRVRECDMFVAECSFPSTGLGFELGLAVSLDKPILAIAKSEAKVTRMILGVNHPKFTFARYNSAEEILPLIESKLT